jgi:BED zinc finger
LTTPKTSFIWNLFQVDATDGTFATCNLCSIRIKRGKDKKSFSTSPLIRHAETKHPDDYKLEKQAAEVKQVDCTPQPPPAKIQKLTAMASSYQDKKIQLKMPQAMERKKFGTLTTPVLRQSTRELSI